MHAYYPGVDKIAHERGFGEFYDAELACADRMVDDLLNRLPLTRSCSSLPITAKSRSAIDFSTPLMIYFD